MEAVLKASGADRFAKQFDNASKSVKSVEDNTKRAGVSIGGMIKAAAGVAATIGIFNTLKNSVDGAISRYDTLNTFPKIMQMMGHSAGDSEGAIQKLSDGIQGLPTTLDDVAKTTQRIATLTGDLGGAVDTTLALNNAFITSGASVADASRGLDQYVQMLSKGEVDLQSWRTLQETMGVGLNETAKAFGFAGESAQNDLYAALKSGEITFDEFNNKLVELSNQTGGFADMAKTSAGGIKTAFTNMRTSVVRGVTNIISKIDEMLASNGLGSIESIVNQAGKAFFSALDSMANAIPPVVSAIKSVYENLKPWLPLITSIIAGVLAFTATLSIINSIKSAITSLKVAFSILNATILANPIALVIAALVAAAALVYLYWEPIKGFFIDLWETIKTSSIAVWEWLKSVWNEAVNFIMSIWLPIAEFFTNLWNGVSNVFNTALLFIKELIARIMGSEIVTEFMATFEVWKNIFMTAWNFIYNIISTVITAIKTFMSNWLNQKKEEVSTALEFIKNIFTTIWNAVVGVLKPILILIKNNIKIAMDYIKNIISIILSAIKGVFQVVFKAISTFVKQVMNNIKGVISIAMNAIKTVFKVIWEIIKGVVVTVLRLLRGDVDGAMARIRSTITNVMGLISGFFKSTWNTIKGIFTSTLSSIKTIVKDGITGALGIVTGLFGKFKDAGKNIITSIAKGISGAIGSVTDAIGKVTGKIRDFLPFSPAKEGALRDIMKIQIPQSIAKSIEAGERVATKAMDGLSNAIYGHMPNMDINGMVSSARVKSSVTHEVNRNDGRMVQLLEKIANSKGVVKLSTGELVGSTYNEYDRVGGEKTSLNERWGR